MRWGGVGHVHNATACKAFGFLVFLLSCLASTSAAQYTVVRGNGDNDDDQDCARTHQCDAAGRIEAAEHEPHAWERA